MKAFMGVLIAVCSVAASAAAKDDGVLPVDQVRSKFHGPSEYRVPEGMAPGGAFIDRIRPMPVENGLTSDTWGGANVKPRNIQNGLEDPEWSYWCMSVRRGEDGKEHMFAVRWPEKHPKGHNAWPNSTIVHAVSDRPTGPFKVLTEIGRGHNVTCYRAKDGTYVLYAIGRAYTASSLNGPWTTTRLTYDLRGMKRVNLSNMSFTQREDGSMLMVSRTGQIWISEDGLKPYKMVVPRSVYPTFKGEFEDPVVWRDEIQYNLIVNDWYGRIAFYLRSRDGIKWVLDAGKAYDPEVVRHPDGSRERWFKLERPSVRQDEFGRATHLYLAAIDTFKPLDKGGDEHSSKILALPLTVPRRLLMSNQSPVNGDTREIEIVIRAENNFNPLTDVDAASLRFGAPSAVDFGKGCRMLRSAPRGSDLAVTFDAAGNGFGAEDYAGKLLGKDRRGELLLGYVRLPGMDRPEPILSAAAPREKSGKTVVTVENLGLAPAEACTFSAMLPVIKEKKTTWKDFSLTVPALAPYASCEVTLSSD